MKCTDYQGVRISRVDPGGRFDLTLGPEYRRALYFRGA